MTTWSLALLLCCLDSAIGVSDVIPCAAQFLNKVEFKELWSANDTYIDHSVSLGQHFSLKYSLSQTPSHQVIMSVGYRHDKGSSNVFGSYMKLFFFTTSKHEVQETKGDWKSKFQYSTRFNEEAIELSFTVTCGDHEAFYSWIGITKKTDGKKVAKNWSKHRLNVINIDSVMFAHEFRNLKGALVKSGGGGIRVSCSFTLCPQNIFWGWRIIGFGRNISKQITDNVQHIRRKTVNMSMILHPKNCRYDDNLKVTCILYLGTQVRKHEVTAYNTPCYLTYDYVTVGIIILFILLLILAATLRLLRTATLQATERKIYVVRVQG